MKNGYLVQDKSGRGRDRKGEEGEWRSSGGEIGKRSKERGEGKKGKKEKILKENCLKSMMILSVTKALLTGHYSSFLFLHDQILLKGGFTFLKQYFFPLNNCQPPCPSQSCCQYPNLHPLIWHHRCRHQRRHFRWQRCYYSHQPSCAAPIP